MAASIQAAIFIDRDDRVLVQTDSFLRSDVTVEQGLQHEAHWNDVLVPQAQGSSFLLWEGLLAWMAMAIQPLGHGSREISIPPRSVGGHAPVWPTEAFPDLVVSMMDAP